MQIHELTQPRKPQLDEIFGIDTVGDAIKSGGATLMPLGATGRQARINAQAARAAAKLEKKLAPLEKVPTLDQALAKLKANPAAQQWINGVVARWPAIANGLNTTTPTASVTEAVGDLSARSRQRNQGVTGTQKPAPAPVASDPYADGFRNWVDSQLKTTSLAELESDAEVKNQLEPLLKQIVAAKNDSTGQKELVKNFFTLAVAANHVVQAKQRDPAQGRARPNSNLGQPMDDTQEPVDTRLDSTNLYFLNRAAHQAGGPAPTRSTGNKWMDSLVQQIWNGR
jgi:hypothetical protein